MATTPNYGWVTPSPSNFVTNLPADFETFADAVDADLGGLLGGTTGQVLAKDSAADHDFSWTTLAAGDKVWTLLNAGGTDLTGATTVTVSGISNKDNLLILCRSGSAGSNSTISLQLNGDTGTTNYDQVPVNISAPNTYATTFLTSQDFSSENGFQIARMNDDGAALFNAGIYINGCKSTGIKAVQVHGGGRSISGGFNQGSRHGFGFYDASAAITSISIVSSSGNFDGGKVWVYGA